ncbi:hypothetical protein EWW49_31460, partial [Pseudomonas syringae]
GTMGHGGDVFVLEMGEPVKIVEPPEKMIHLSGLAIRSEKTPHCDISIEVTGPRSGEKLSEELLIGHNVVATEHPLLMSANEDWLPRVVWKGCMTKLLVAVDRDYFPSQHHLLTHTVNAYTSAGETVEWLNQARCGDTSFHQHRAGSGPGLSSRERP